MPVEKEIQFTNRLREATVEYMSRNKLSGDDMAKIIGCSRQNFHAFLKGTLLGEDKLDILVATIWRRNSLISGHLRWVADVLDSPDVSEKIKGETYITLINSLMALRDRQ